MKVRIRELLRAVPFRPFIIRRAEGREYRVDHPDFVLASTNNQSQVIVEGLDDRIYHLSALLITSIEEIPSASLAA